MLYLLKGVNPKCAIRSMKGSLNQSNGSKACDVLYMLYLIFRYQLLTQGNLQINLTYKTYNTIWYEKLKIFNNFEVEHCDDYPSLITRELKNIGFSKYYST